MLFSTFVYIYVVCQYICNHYKYSGHYFACPDLSEHGSRVLMGRGTLEENSTRSYIKLYLQTRSLPPSLATPPSCLQKCRRVWKDGMVQVVVNYYVQYWAGPRWISKSCRVRTCAVAAFMVASSSFHEQGASIYEKFWIHWIHEYPSDTGFVLFINFRLVRRSGTTIAPPPRSASQYPPYSFVLQPASIKNWIGYSSSIASETSTVFASS